MAVSSFHLTSPGRMRLRVGERVSLGVVERYSGCGGSRACRVLQATVADGRLLRQAASSARLKVRNKRGERLLLTYNVTSRWIVVIGQRLITDVAGCMERNGAGSSQPLAGLTDTEIQPSSTEAVRPALVRAAVIHWFTSIPSPMRMSRCRKTRPMQKTIWLGQLAYRG